LQCGTRFTRTFPNCVRKLVLEAPVGLETIDTMFRRPRASVSSSGRWGHAAHRMSDHIDLVYLQMIKQRLRMRRHHIKVHVQFVGLAGFAEMDPIRCGRGRR
jgi:hypothetical protein